VTQIVIEPHEDVTVDVTMRYDLAGADPIRYMVGGQLMAISIHAEKVIVIVRNGELESVTVMGQRALLDGGAGQDRYRNYYLPVDFHLMPLWLLNLSQVAVLEVANAGLVP
jgi:hypothetical protein